MISKVIEYFDKIEEIEKNKRIREEELLEEKKKLQKDLKELLEEILPFVTDIQASSHGYVGLEACVSESMSENLTIKLGKLKTIDSVIRDSNAAADWSISEMKKEILSFISDELCMNKNDIDIGINCFTIRNDYIYIHVLNDIMIDLKWNTATISATNKGIKVSI